MTPGGISGMLKFRINYHLGEVDKMRRHGPVHVIVYAPKTEEGKLELSKRIAQIHADAVNRRIKELNCPTKQKLQLLDAVIHTTKHPER